MKSLRTLMPYVRRYRWRFLFGILFVLLANAINVQIPVLVGDAVNTITDRATLLSELKLLGILIASMAALAGAFRYLMRRVLIDTSRDIEFDYRNDIYQHLQGLDPTFYDGTSTGDVMARMTNDIDVVRMMIGPAIMYTANTVFTVPMVVAAMMAQDWITSLLGFAPLILLPFAVKAIGGHLHRRSREQQDQMSDLTTFVQESLAGIRVIKAYNQEQSMAGRFLEENEEYIHHSMAVAKIQTFFFPSIRLIAGAGLLLILYFGARRIVTGQMDIGTLVSLVMLFGMLIWPLIAAGWVINLFQRSMASLDRINEILSAQTKVSDSSTVVPVEQLPERLDIEFRHMTFQYEGGSEPVLRDISLTVPAGTTLGIVGRVGTGKSTLVHLLLRYYPVERGSIFIGGIDIHDWPVERLRREVGIVFQETFLFSDTIAENVRFGALTDLTEEQVIEAAKKADVHKDVAAFPNAYETILGERGINLSGGQKQRLSIARAIVRDASILILDDCLSAVDTHTEEAILKSLRGEMKGRTTFLISHRISTVALADEIIVLEGGRISQRGTHDQLVRQPGLYAELYKRQLLEEEVEGIA